MGVWNLFSVRTCSVFGSGSWGILQNGVEQFSDRNYVLTNIPPHLLGMRYFKGPCHSNKVKLTITSPKVYILVSLGNPEENLYALETQSTPEVRETSSIYRKMGTESFAHKDGFTLLTFGETSYVEETTRGERKRERERETVCTCTCVFDCM
jgi:hypothetical protein